MITDSGSLQKEAYIAGKPSITLRPEIEWVETIKAGWKELMIHDNELAEKIVAYPDGERTDLYGKDVAKRMVLEMEKHFK